MNQLVSWNRRRFPLGHGPFANDTFCKTTGELATLRKRHGIQCATMGTKEGTSRRDFPCQRHGTPPFVQSKLYSWQRVRSRTKPHPARHALPAALAALSGLVRRDHAPWVISALLQTRAPVRGACSATSRVQRMGKSLDRPLFGIHVPGDEILP